MERLGERQGPRNEVPGTSRHLEDRSCIRCNPTRLFADNLCYVNLPCFCCGWRSRPL